MKKEYSNIGRMVSNIETFNIDNVQFTEPEKTSLNGGTIKFKRVGIKIKGEDGKLQPLVITTDKCYSWGLQQQGEKFGQKDYALAIVLKNRGDAPGELKPAPYQEKFLEVFENIVEKCNDHCVENKIALGKYDLEKHDLKKSASYLHIKKELKNGQYLPDEGRPPTLYAKALYNKTMRSRLGFTK